MNITKLAPTGDGFKALYQNDDKSKGFIIGLSGTLAKDLDDTVKLEKLNEIAEALVKSYGYAKLDGVEKIYTSEETNLPWDQTIAGKIYFTIGC